MNPAWRRKSSGDGTRKVRAEWRLVCTAHNLLKLAGHAAAKRAAVAPAAPAQGSYARNDALERSPRGDLVGRRQGGTNSIELLDSQGRREAAPVLARIIHEAER